MSDTDVVEEIERVRRDAESRAELALRLRCTRPPLAKNKQVDAIADSLAVRAVVYRWQGLIYNHEYFRWRETPWLKAVLTKECDGGMLERVQIQGRASKSRPLGVPRRFQISGRDISYVRCQSRHGYAFVVLQIKFLPTRSFCARLNRVEFDHYEIDHVYGKHFLRSIMSRLPDEIVTVVQEYLHVGQSGHHICGASCWPFRRSPNKVLDC
jgi:hypothetical protein